jgi:hypothetical protein
MSNTSDLSPYDTTNTSSGSGAIGTGLGVAAGVAVACAAGAVLGAVALAKWLSETTPEDQAAVERLNEEQRRERIRGYKPTTSLSGGIKEPATIITQKLTLREIEPLVLSAQKLGYRLEPLARTDGPLAQQPQILLRSASGTRMAIERNTNGRLIVSTAGDRLCIQTLVRQHTVDRAMDHCSKMGMEVKSAKLANGEVQIFARERNTHQRGGAAEVRAQVRTDGTAWVDIDQVKGNRCEEIVSQLAEAIGAEVTGARKKDSYFQLPGEPTKTHVRA